MNPTITSDQKMLQLLKKLNQRLAKHGFHIRRLANVSIARTIFFMHVTAKFLEYWFLEKPVYSLEEP
jgi:hypothetical protein